MRKSDEMLKKPCIHGDRRKEGLGEGKKKKVRGNVNIASKKNKKKKKKKVYQKDLKRGSRGSKRGQIGEGILWDV